jgi:hypothetical protein
VGEGEDEALRPLEAAGDGAHEDLDSLAVAQLAPATLTAEVGLVDALEDQALDTDPGLRVLLEPGHRLVSSERERDLLERRPAGTQQRRQRGALVP